MPVNVIEAITRSHTQSVSRARPIATVQVLPRARIIKLVCVAMARYSNTSSPVGS